MPAQSHSIPPKIRTETAPLGVYAGVVLGIAILGAGAVVFFFNPSTHGFYPICLFHSLTGWNCPGCGGTRSLHALLHGKFALALKDNALFVALFVAAVMRGTWFAVKIFRRQPVGELLPANVLWTVLTFAAVFTVLRNLPAFGFLSP
jgi:hypothetical protein